MLKSSAKSLCALSLFYVVGIPLVSAQKKEEKAVFVYQDAKRKSPLESYYYPELYMPAEKASHIGVRRDVPASDLDKGVKGTVLQFTMGFRGGDEFAGVAFKPAGAKFGAKKGFNIAELLAAGPRQKVYLKFRARRKANTTAIVKFSVGGISNGKAVDSIDLPVSGTSSYEANAWTEPKEHIKLSADWIEYRIDLAGEDLKSIVCPFHVWAESNKQPQQKKVTFYVDDVRFVAE